MSSLTPPWIQLRQRRIHAGLTQEQLATGRVSQTALSQMEKGKRLPAQANLRAFAQVLKVSPMLLVLEWTPLFKAVEASSILFRCVQTIEASNRRSSGVDAAAELRNMSGLYQARSHLLSTFDNATFQGYLTAWAGDDEKADSVLTAAWTSNLEDEHETTLRKALVVEAYARRRLAEVLSRPAAATFWYRRALYRRQTRHFHSIRL